MNRLAHTACIAFLAAFLSAGTCLAQPASASNDTPLSASSDTMLTRLAVLDMALNSTDSASAWKAMGSWVDSMPSISQQPILVENDEGAPELIRVDWQWLKESLVLAAADSENTAGRDAARRMVHTLVDQLGRNAVTPVVRDTTDHRRAMAEILSRPEYQTRKSDNVLIRFLDWLFGKLFAWLRRLFPDNPSSAAPPPPFDFSSVGRILLYTFGALGIALLIVLLIRRFRARKEALSEPEPPVQSGWLQPGESTDPDDHVRRAAALAAGGNYRPAIRHLFLSFLLALDAKEFIRFEEVKTNRELVETLRTGQDTVLIDAAVFMAEMFDRKWYGLQPATAEDYAACLETFQVLRLGKSAREVEV